MGTQDKKVFIIRTRDQAYDLASKISRLNPETMPVFQITVQEYKKNRSVSQNRLMWKWLRIIADDINEKMLEKDPDMNPDKEFTDDDVHEWFKNKYLESKIVEFRGEVIRKVKSTASLRTGQFTDYLHNIDQYCAEHMSLVLPHPDDLYWEAMGLKQNRD